jgi:formate hydrogenlyase subunit 4
MVVIRDLAVQGAQMLLVLLVAPLFVGFVRKVKARLLRRQGPPLVQPYLDLVRLMRKEVVLAENASWLFRVTPYLIFAATWVAASLVPTSAPIFRSPGRPISSPSLRSSAARVFSWRSPASTSAPASAASDRAAK